MKKQGLKIAVIDIGEKAFSKTKLGIPVPTVAFWWRLGGKMFSWAFDYVFYVKDAEEFWDVLRAFKPGEVDEAQLWSHGGPGRPIVNHVALAADHPAWSNIKGADFWFRSCSVAAEAAGVRFMTALSLRGLSPVAHLAIIGAWAMQSHTVGLKAGSLPTWPVEDRELHSAPWAPRTIPAFWMWIPNWVWKS